MYFFHKLAVYIVASFSDVLSLRFFINRSNYKLDDVKKQLHRALYVTVNVRIYKCEVIGYVNAIEEGDATPRMEALNEW